MPKKSNNSPLTSATHRLSLEIAKPQAAVWKAFTREIQSWWPKDFYATESPQRIVFEVKPGGRLYEDSGKGWARLVSRDRRGRAELDHDVGVYRAAVWGAGDVAAQCFIFGAGEINHGNGSDGFDVRLSGRHDGDERGMAVVV
jgi:hypothetical protein